MKNQSMHISNTVNRPRTKLSKVTGVVVHWTANENKGAHAIANRNYFQNTTRAASCHLIVDDEMLVEALPWKRNVAEMAYQVGAKSYNQTTLKQLGTTYPNNCTIGLEICVNSDGDFKEAYKNGVAVTAMMLKEHGLGTGQLYRHFDVTGKSCPGFFVDNGYAKKYLNTTAMLAWKNFVLAVARVLEGGKSETPVVTPAPSTEGILGYVEILSATLNLRAEASLTSKVVRQLKQGEKYKAYSTKNNMYSLGSGWVSAGKAYVKFTPVVQEKVQPEEMFRVFRNGDQEGAFTIQTNATVFARELHEEDPFDLVTVQNSDHLVLLKLQNLEKVVEVYRVRKSVDDVETQKGAFGLLENAKRVANENPGYRVYDGAGKLVYLPIVEVPKVEPTPAPLPLPQLPQLVEEIQPDWHKIMGPSVATVEQMIYFVNQNYPKAPKDVAKHFYEVGILEGVRGDVALAQAIKETGGFNYGGDVKPEQNNFCGLGAVGNGAQGLSFDTVREGVTAQIQHLKAYGSMDVLKLDCVDPRFKYVTPRGKALHVEQLAGKWAVPGYETTKYKSLAEAMHKKDAYGHQIMKIVDRMKTVSIPQMPQPPQPQPEKPTEPVKDVPAKEEINISLLNQVLELLFNFLSKLGKK